MLRKVFGLIPLAVAVALAAGCSQSPMKMGAAAVLADERITTAEVQDAVRSFREAQRRSQLAPSQLQLPDPQSLPRSELMLLLRFRIADEAARSEGITVSDADVDEFIASQGSLEDLELQALVGGIPPSLLRDAVRDALIRQELAARVAPQGADPRQEAQLVHEHLVSYARDLGITVSPRYGQFDYESMTVAPAAGSELSRPESPAAG